MLNGLQIGEEFSLLLGQQKTVTVSVSQIILTNIYCSGAAVAIADIAEKDRKLFRATSEKYYLISPEDPGEPSEAHLGLDWSKLPLDKTNRLQQTLQTILKNELPGIIENSEPYHKRLLDAGYTWPLRWQSRDRKLQDGDTTLLFDAQQVWLKQAEPIYFVRARWVIKGAMVFGISSWIDEQMQIKQVDTTVAKRLRFRTYAGIDIQNTDYGLILNLFDQDRDGNGEVLFYHGGYEGASFTLLEYNADKFIPTGVAMNIGC